jgi:two-component system response regulator VicR
MARILVAGDDALALDILVSEIEGEGHETVTAWDGQEAYDLALSETPDMVFLQAVLPVFDGIETCAMIRNDPEIDARLGIVLLISEPIDSRRTEKAGVTDTLPKSHDAHETARLLIKYLPPESLPDRD